MSDSIADVRDPGKRDMLKKVAIGGALVVGVGALFKGLAKRGGLSEEAQDDSWTADSGFRPRADQIGRVLGRK